MKNIYKILEQEYIRSKNKKNFDKNKFNLYIENTIRNKFKNCDNFYVVKDTLASPSGTYYLNSQAYQKNNDMYETLYGLLLYINNTKENKLIVRKGFLTCEDLEYNLYLKNKEKNNGKLF